MIDWSTLFAVSALDSFFLNKYEKLLRVEFETVLCFGWCDWETPSMLFNCNFLARSSFSCSRSSTNDFICDSVRQLETDSTACYKSPNSSVRINHKHHGYLPTCTVTYRYANELGLCAAALSCLWFCFGLFQSLTRWLALNIPRIQN